MSGGGIARAHRRVIFASSLGTVFEWYDFYLYGSLSVIISRQFFSGVNETTGFIFALLAFAAGFFVRPFGALVFGRELTSAEIQQLNQLIESSSKTEEASLPKSAPKKPETTRRDYRKR